MAETPLFTPKNIRSTADVRCGSWTAIALKGAAAPTSELTAEFFIDAAMRTVSSTNMFAAAKVAPTQLLGQRRAVAGVRARTNTRQSRYESMPMYWMRTLS